MGPVLDLTVVGISVMGLLPKLFVVAFAQFAIKVLVAPQLAIEGPDAEDPGLLAVQQWHRLRSQRVIRTQRFLLSDEDNVRVKLLAFMMELPRWLTVMLLAASSDSLSEQAVPQRFC